MRLTALAMVAAARLAAAQSYGDVNCDGRVTVSDVGALEAIIFHDASSNCAEADVNTDGRVGSADVVGLINVLEAPVPFGPSLTYLGLAVANGTAFSPLGQIDGVPVFFSSSAAGFKVVVEGRAGLSGIVPGTVTFRSNPSDPTQRPDIQMESSKALGNGSRTACDGGVPAVDPPDFGPSQTVADALNDLACNFVSATARDSACTLDTLGNNGFVGSDTEVQFCLQVSTDLSFPLGDTLLSVRLRDTAGNIGPLQQMLVRVAPGPVPATFTPSTTPTPIPPTPTRTPTPTRRATATASLTPVSPTPPHGGTATATFHPSATPSRTATPTQTPTPAATPSLTATIGPVVTFFGLTKPDDTLLPPSGVSPDGIPVFSHSAGWGFSIVVEGKPGPSGADVGWCALGVPIADQFPDCTPDLTSFPDLQIEVSNPLGNGSPAVCDRSGPNAGGVPAIDPINFTPTQTNTDAINDLACRFLNGSGSPGGRTLDEACVQSSTAGEPTGQYGYVDATTKMQFCALITQVDQFPIADTLLTARLRDVDGNVGAPAHIIIHIGP